MKALAIITAFGLTHFATSAAGQVGFQAEEVWDRFVKECSSALDAPLKLTLDGLRDPENDNPAMLTSDALIFQSSLPLDDALGPEIEFAIRHVGGDIWTTGTFAYCTIQLNFPDEGFRLGLYEIAREKAPVLLGGSMTILGGPVIGGPNSQPDDFVAHQAIFASGPFPAEQTIRVLELSRFANLTMTRFTRR